MMKSASKAYRSKSGFTLLEASAAAMLTVAVLGMAIGGFMFALKNTNESDVQSELDIDVQLAMERLKKDLRLSSLDEIFYYPAGPGPYTALSFPLAEDSDGDGLFELDADGRVIWDKTVVYHIWPSSPHQLRVTTFSNRDNDMSDAQRQEQLDVVVKTGSGSDTYNGGNASTHVIFENLLDWTIRPQAGIFDAYSSTLEREHTSLGFALLDKESHTFEFKVAGKNADSSGYKIGIDQLTVSPSYGEREAEAQLPVTAQSGASASAQYIASGSWKGNYHLYFPATDVGDYFTLTMDNDRWEETNFGADGYVADNTEVKFDDTLSPKDFVVQLDGNETTWEAALQTGTATAISVSNNLLQGAQIAVHINGAQLLTNGNWIASNGRKCQLTFQAGAIGYLQVNNVHIVKTSAEDITAFTYDETPVHATFHGASDSPVMSTGYPATTDPINMEISKTNNYVVIFNIRNESFKGYPAAWKNQRTTNPDCLIRYADSTLAYTNCIFGLASIDTTYPANGTYTSQIFDTRLAAPIYGDIAWNADLPSGTALTTKVRTGDQPDLSDADDWSSLSAASSAHAILASSKRYVQFQAQLQSSSDGLSTPQLKDVTIDWTGEMQLVNISATMTKGPDYGVVEVLVDGVPLQSALGIDLMIYKDIFSLNRTDKRVTSSLVANIRPRNTGR